MNKIPPVANKICSRREEEIAYAKHQQKLKEIKANNSKVLQQQYANERVISTSSSLRRNDRKKEILNELYYTEVERENRILLEKMSKIMKQTKQSHNTSVFYTESSPSKEPRSLNKIIRKRELVRITMENQEILKRIQEKTPTYNHNDWAKQYKLTEQYLHNISEYPVMKSNRPITTTNTTFMNHTNKDGSLITKPDIIKNRKQSEGEQRRLSGTSNIGLYQKDYNPDDKANNANNSRKIVLFKKGVRIGLGLYIIEMTFDKKIFQISADDVENPDIKFLTFPIEEGKKILNEHNNDYQKIIERLYFKEGILKLKGYEVSSNHTLYSEKTSEIAEKMMEESGSDVSATTGAKKYRINKGHIRSSSSFTKRVENKSIEENSQIQSTAKKNDSSDKDASTRHESETKKEDFDDERNDHIIDKTDTEMKESDFIPMKNPNYEENQNQKSNIKVNEEYSEEQYYDKEALDKENKLQEKKSNEKLENEEVINGKSEQNELSKSENNSKILIKNQSQFSKDNAGLSKRSLNIASSSKSIGKNVVNQKSEDAIKHIKSENQLNQTSNNSLLQKSLIKKPSEQENDQYAEEAYYDEEPTENEKQPEEDRVMSKSHSNNEDKKSVSIIEKSMSKHSIKEENNQSKKSLIQQSLTKKPSLNGNNNEDNEEQYYEEELLINANKSNEDINPKILNRQSAKSSNSINKNIEASKEDPNIEKQSQKSIKADSSITYIKEEKNLRESYESQKDAIKHENSMNRENSISDNKLENQLVHKSSERFRRRSFRRNSSISKQSQNQLNESIADKLNKTVDILHDNNSHGEEINTNNEINGQVQNNEEVNENMRENSLKNDNSCKDIKDNDNTLAKSIQRETSFKSYRSIKSKVNRELSQKSIKKTEENEEDISNTNFENFERKNSNISKNSKNNLSEHQESKTNLPNIEQENDEKIEADESKSVKDEIQENEENIEKSGIVDDLIANSKIDNDNEEVSQQILNNEEVTKEEILGEEEGKEDLVEDDIDKIKDDYNIDNKQENDGVEHENNMKIIENSEEEGYIENPQKNDENPDKEELKETEIDKDHEVNPNPNDDEDEYNEENQDEKPNEEYENLQEQEKEYLISNNEEGEKVNEEINQISNEDQENLKGTSVDIIAKEDDHQSIHDEDDLEKSKFQETNNILNEEEKEEVNLNNNEDQPNDERFTKVNEEEYINSSRKDGEIFIEEESNEKLAEKDCKADVNPEDDENNKDMNEIKEEKADLDNKNEDDKLDSSQIMNENHEINDLSIKDKINSQKSLDLKPNDETEYNEDNENLLDRMSHDEGDQEQKNEEKEDKINEENNEIKNEEDMDNQKFEEEEAENDKYDEIIEKNEDNSDDMKDKDKDKDKEEEVEVDNKNDIELANENSDVEKQKEEEKDGNEI